MQTSNFDIYAVGDMVEIEHFITKSNALISLAGPANKQGRIAADNICGIKSEYKGSLASSIIKVFDLDVAVTGITERECLDRKVNYEKVILTPASHATYYPSAKVLTLKVIYDKDTLKILGAQVVGYDGVDKRIDVLATAIRANMLATELKDLDLAYAPPYSSAKDPVNMAGFIIDNIENRVVKQFDYDQIEELRKRDNVILLDTRTKYEYVRGHAKGFINIPLDDLRDRLDELEKNKEIYVMCQSGLRSYLATRILVQNGYIAYNFIGGYRLYSSIANDEKLTLESYHCGMDK
jgi:rhodanese-related sulfurtransferase